MKSKKRISKLLVASLLSYGLSSCGLNNVNVVRAAERIVDRVKIDDTNLFKTKTLKKQLECPVCLENLKTIFSKNQNPAVPNRIVRGKLTPDTILLAENEIICEQCRRVFHKKCWDPEVLGVGGHGDRCPFCREEKPKNDVPSGKTDQNLIDQFWNYMSLKSSHPGLYKLPWPGAEDRPARGILRHLDIEIDVRGKDRKMALKDAEDKKKKKAEKERKAKAEKERADEEKKKRNEVSSTASANLAKSAFSPASTSSDTSSSAAAISITSAALLSSLITGPAPITSTVSNVQPPAPTPSPSVGVNSSAAPSVVTPTGPSSSNPAQSISGQGQMGAQNASSSHGLNHGNGVDA